MSTSASILMLYAGISLAAWIWLTARVWKTSVFGAILTFFLGLPAFYFLFKYWGDKERGIGAPFFTNLAINVIFMGIMFSMPGFMSGDLMAGGTNRARDLPVKSNPAMEKWCIEKNDAVYDHDLQTCVEAPPGQKVSQTDPSADIMDQLESHFQHTGLETSFVEVDESTPGAKGFADNPDPNRVVQFEIKANSLVPTSITVARCKSAEACSMLAARMDKPDSPMSVASNGDLLFMGVNLIGDPEKIRQAKQAFLSFRTG